MAAPQISRRGEPVLGGNPLDPVRPAPPRRRLPAVFLRTRRGCILQAIYPKVTQIETRNRELADELSRRASNRRYRAHDRSVVRYLSRRGAIRPTTQTA